MKILFIVSLMLFCVSGCSSKYEIANIDSKGRNIIFFGNSITAGVGAEKGEDYPAIISRKLGIRVINAGVSGDTTRDALARLEKDVLRKDPLIVVLEFGANDFFRGMPKDETLGNIDKIVERLLEEDAIVVLTEVRTNIYSKYLKGFKGICRKRNIFLIENLMKGVITNPEFMSDGIHPNRDGYNIIAERVIRVIKPLIALNKKAV